MKTSNELVKDYRKINTTCKELENQIQETNDRSVLSELTQQLTLNKVKMDIIYNNYSYAIREEVIEAIKTILPKYAGKQYGEKTRQKISEDIHEICGCRVYINNQYSYASSFSFYPDNRIGYDPDNYIYLSKQPNVNGILDSNQILNINDFELYNHKHYYENVNKTAKDKIKLFEKLNKVAKEFNAIADEYNDFPHNKYIDKIYLMHDISNY